MLSIYILNIIGNLEKSWCWVQSDDFYTHIYISKY